MRLGFASGSSKNTDITLKINLNFYVDDFLKSSSTEENLKDLALILTSIFDNCGSRLTKWLYNSGYILSSFHPSGLFSKLVDLDISLQPTERALCMLWDIENDTFILKLVKKEAIVAKDAFLV